MIPACWDLAIMNRAFKRRVIQLVISRLPLLVDLAPDEQLVIDYMGPPLLYVHGNATPSPIMDLEPLGEVPIFFICFIGRCKHLCDKSGRRGTGRSQVLSLR